MVEEQPYEAKSHNYPSPETSTTTGEPLLRRAIDEISSLISLSYSTRVFSVKWQIIRNKLDELNSFLISAENCPTSENNSNLSDLISLITQTVARCRDLAGRCIGVNFSGKLLMQSDLDMVISRLDFCNKKLMGIYRAGLISSNGFALVVLKPGSGSTRDDMRFYVKDLVTRLKVGDFEMKRQGLICLNEVLMEDERYVKIVVDLGDLVILLASFLDSSDLRIQEEASMAVDVISGFGAYKGVLIGSGLMGPLIRTVESGSLRAKEHAIQTLKNLTENGDNAWAFSAHGGVTVLLNLCSMDDPRPELVGLCCWVLRNLVGVDEIKRFMIENGAILTLIKPIKGKDEIVQIGSVELLISMASGDQFVRESIIKEGGARALVRIFDPKSTFSFKLREIALRAIENLCFHYLEYIHLLVTYGFIDHLLFFLRKGDVSIQELAFKAASRLSGTSEEARKTMGDVGFVPEFVKFLEAKSYDIREMAAEALSNMVLEPKNRKNFANDDHNIALVLQLLDPKEGNSGNMEFLLSILMSLSSCHHARRKISHSGYVNNIEKLANAGISDAKRILRKLSTNRFRNLLNGIWHSS